MERSTQRRAVLLGAHGPLHAAVTEALQADRFLVAGEPDGATPDALVCLFNDAPVSHALRLEESGHNKGWQSIWRRAGRVAAKAMAARGDGAIVFVGSDPTLLGSVRPLAIELAPQRVTVNAVVSSSTEGAIHLIRYLCSQEASYVTAQTFRAEQP